MHLKFITFFTAGCFCEKSKWDLEVEQWDQLQPTYEGLIGFESFSSESFSFRSWHEFEDSSGENVLLVGGGSELIIFPGGDLGAPVVQRIEPDKMTKRTCERTGEMATNCNNFIRSISKCEGRDEIAFCGTNAFKPKFYSVTLTNLYKDNPEFNVRSGDAICPSSATTSSILSIVSCGTEGEHKVISAIGRERTSNSPSVIRSSAWPDELVGDEQRLSDPRFLSVVQRPSRFLFFYRDTERRKETPYVASVCANSVASSFVKAEISCDIGDFGFSKMVATRETATGMFVTFVTKSEFFRKSAICFYPFALIQRQISSSSFLDENLNSVKWPPAEAHTFPHPAACGRTTPNAQSRQARADFARKYHLLESRIRAEPILYAESAKFGSFSTFALDGDEVLFIGTTGGFVLTAVRYTNTRGFKLIDARQVFNSTTQCGNVTIVRDLKLSTNKQTKKTIFVAFDQCVAKMRISNCQTTGKCAAENCNNDPYCSYDKVNGTCLASNRSVQTFSDSCLKGINTIIMSTEAKTAPSPVTTTLVQLVTPLPLNSTMAMSQASTAIIIPAVFTGAAIFVIGITIGIFLEKRMHARRRSRLLTSGKRGNIESPPNSRTENNSLLSSTKVCLPLSFPHVFLLNSDDAGASSFWHQNLAQSRLNASK